MSEVAPLRVVNPVASNVRAELARRGIKISHLPRYVGQNVAYWGRRDRGQTPYDANDLIALADLLDVAPGVFFAGADLGNAKNGRTESGSLDPTAVRRQGLEPRTRYISASASHDGIARILHVDVADLIDAAAPATVSQLPTWVNQPGVTKVKAGR